tara:strand:- start:3064 stop:3318 length:255 start_codon:yes stop_codon:yes gene_type:complete
MIKTERNTDTEIKTKQTQFLDSSYDTQIALLKQDITTIKDNHLAHMSEDIDRIEKKVDKIDTRIWAVLGLLVASVLGPMIANMF